MAAAGRDGRIALWVIPQPVGGTAEAVRLRVETLTGMHLDANGTVRELDPDAVRQRRRRLEELGSPPSRSD
jgi:hypothetical protein